MCVYVLCVCVCVCVCVCGVFVCVFLDMCWCLSVIHCRLYLEIVKIQWHSRFIDF